jgi:hypothetical protein
MHDACLDNVDRQVVGTPGAGAWQRGWVTCLGQVCAVHASLISQLEAVGGLEEWALYVALHVPDCAAAEGRGVRDRLVRELLLRHAPALAASPAKQAFLLERLRIPRAWLADALATWYRYKRDAAGESAAGPLSSYTAVQPVAFAALGPGKDGGDVNADVCAG